MSDDIERLDCSLLQYIYSDFEHYYGCERKENTAVILICDLFKTLLKGKMLQSKEVSLP